MIPASTRSSAAICASGKGAAPLLASSIPIDREFTSLTAPHAPAPACQARTAIDAVNVWFKAGSPEWGRDTVLELPPYLQAELEKPGRVITGADAERHVSFRRTPT